MTTPNFSITELAASQAQKYVTVNEALRVVDTAMNLTVIRADNTAPPGSPAEGDKYIPLATATGAWAGQENNIAAYINAEWKFFIPAEGWRVYDQNANNLLIYDGSAWVSFTSGLSFQNIPMLGVNTTADATNRLSVSAPATLLNNEGAGHQLKINKNASGDTASLLFQSNWTGYAEMGLAGDTDFSVKTSDGTSWFTSIKCSSTDGQVSFPAGLSGQIEIFDTGRSIFIGEGAGASDDLSTNYNTFLGYFTGRLTASGSNNSAVGANSLRSNTTGNNNSALGVGSLFSNTTGGSNVSSGLNSLYDNTVGNSNTAIGAYAMRRNINGSNLTALGRDAGRYDGTGADNTASSNSVYLGYDARPSASGNTNELVAGFQARGNGSNTVTLGNSSITGAYCQVAWTVVSDKRDKEVGEPVSHGLAFIEGLAPISYRYKDRDTGVADGPMRYGFLAQDILALEGDDPVIVDASNPDHLRMTDASLVAVLVRAVQELSQRVKELEANAQRT